MKTLSPLLLCLCAVLLASPQIAVADDDTSTTQTNGSTAAQRAQFMRNAFAQLDLTDEQKQQIKQIRQTVDDKTQRRQEIMAVLTPEQKEKLKEIIQEYRSTHGGAGDATAGPGSAPAGAGGTNSGASSASAGSPDVSDLAPGAN